MRRHRIAWVLVCVVGLYLAVVTAGCAPSVTAPTAETKPTSPPASSSAETAERTPGPTQGYEVYENKDPFQPQSGAGATTAVIATPTGQTGVAVHSVSLASISTDGTKATISVDGTNYPDLAVGSTFATSFQLMSIGTGSVVILYGDNRYTLYLGETLTVK